MRDFKYSKIAVENFCIEETTLFLQEVEKKKQVSTKSAPKSRSSSKSEQPVIKKGSPEDAAATKIQALWRGILLRKSLAILHRKFQAAYNISVWEFIKREGTFIDSIKKAINEIDSQIKQVKAKAGIQTNSKLIIEVNNVLINLKAVVEVHDMVYKKLLEVWETSWPLIENIGSILLPKINIFIVYGPYIEAYSRVQKVVQKHLDVNNLSAALGKELTPITDHFNKVLHTKSSNSRNIDEIFMLPFKHLNGWIVSLHSLCNCLFLLKQTQVNDFPYTVDLENTLSVHGIVNRIINNFEELKNHSNYLIIQKVKHSISFPSSISNQNNANTNVTISTLLINNVHRKFIRQGSMHIATENRYIFLFHDICVVTKLLKNTQKKRKYRFQYSIDLLDISVEDNNSTNSKEGFILHTPSRPYSIIAKSPEEKLLWYISFQKIAQNWSKAIFGVPLQKNSPSSLASPNFMTSRSLTSPTPLIYSQTTPPLPMSSSTSILPISTPPSSSVPIPPIIEKISNQLIFEDAVNEQTLCSFDNLYSITSLKMIIEKLGVNINLYSYSIKSQVGVLKLYFEELPVPLLEWNFCLEFPLFKEKDRNTVDVDAFQEMISCLPPAHYSLLQHIIRLFSLSEIDTKLIALTWAHYFVRNNRETIDSSLFIHRPAIDIMKALIDQYSAIFNQPRKTFNSRRSKNAFFLQGPSLSANFAKKPNNLPRPNKSLPPPPAKSHSVSGTVVSSINEQKITYIDLTKKDEFRSNSMSAKKFQSAPGSDIGDENDNSNVKRIKSARDRTQNEGDNTEKKKKKRLSSVESSSTIRKKKKSRSEPVNTDHTVKKKRSKRLSKVENNNSISPVKSKVVNNQKVDNKNNEIKSDQKPNNNNDDKAQVEIGTPLNKTGHIYGVNLGNIINSISKNNADNEENNNNTNIKNNNNNTIDTTKETKKIESNREIQLVSLDLSLDDIINTSESFDLSILNDSNSPRGLLDSSLDDMSDTSIDIDSSDSSQSDYMMLLMNEFLHIDKKKDSKSNLTEGSKENNNSIENENKNQYNNNNNNNGIKNDESANKNNNINGGNKVDIPSEILSIDDIIDILNIDEKELDGISL